MTTMRTRRMNNNGMTEVKTRKLFQTGNDDRDTYGVSGGKKIKIDSICTAITR